MPRRGLIWAHDVLIPVDVDQFSIDALELLLGQVAALIQETRTTPPRYRGLVINRIDRPFSAFHQKVYDACTSSRCHHRRWWGVLSGRGVTVVTCVSGGVAPHAK